MAIKADSEIKISVGIAMATALTLVAGIGGVFWLVALFVFGEVKDDVAVIRDDLSAMRTQSEAKVTVLEASGGDVEKALIELAAKLEVTNERLQNLSDNLLSVDQRLSGSIARQQEFERFIVTRLAEPAVLPPSFPKEWVQSQKDIVTEISSGTDPLALWIKAFAIEN